MGADNTFGETNFNPDMMTPPDKLREIAERDLNKRIVGILMAHGVNSIDAFNSTPDITALISEHYYPKDSRYEIAIKALETIHHAFYADGETPDEQVEDLRRIALNALEEIDNLNTREQ